MPKGTKLSAETKAKMSKSRSKEKNPNWKGGNTIKSTSILVKERDDYTCQMCGLRDKDIIMVDHIVPRYIRLDLYLHINNLQCLCPNCHARKTSKDRKKIAQFKRLRTHITKHRYQNSVCKRGSLHNFLQVKQTPDGYLERCKKCGLQIHFPAHTPNHIYLSYHVRSALQKHDPMFKKEYPNII